MSLDFPNSVGHKWDHVGEQPDHLRRSPPRSPDNSVVTEISSKLPFSTESPRDDYKRKSIDDRNVKKARISPTHDSNDRGSEEKRIEGLASTHLSSNVKRHDDNYAWRSNRHSHQSNNYSRGSNRHSDRNDRDERDGRYSHSR